MCPQVKCSVVLITYNQKEYVKTALESILMQKTSFPVEIIVSDDASTDGTQEILRDIRDKNPGRVTLFLRKENGGATANAYGMLKRAKGEYIASLEGDDRWTDENYLERNVRFLDEHKGIIGIQDRCRVVDECLNEITDKDILKGKNFWEFDKQVYTLDDYLNWRMPGHISALVYRNIYKDKTWDYSVMKRIHPMVGDRTILMQLVARGDICCSDHVSMDYRLCTQSSGNNWMARFHGKNSRLDEYELICRVEYYLQKRFNKRISMAKTKRSKIAAAAIVYMLNRTDENKIALMNIVFFDNNPVRDGAIALFAVIQKKFWILVGKPEHRVWV